MPKPEDAGDAAFEQASEQLNEGLKTCRSVVRNYRHMLGGDEPVGETAEAAEQSGQPVPPVPD